MDSLDLVELAQIVEEEYGVRDQGRGHAEASSTVGQAVDLVAERAGQ